ncbi:MAG: polyphosphate polymerase domain-containing protein, partial [Planctomycetota bacterium]
MDGVSLMDRVDTKYVFSAGELATLLPRLIDDYRVLEIDGLRRSLYSTLYYDTPSLDCYHQHHNGKANRRKYRIRTYVSSGDTYFEVKTKTNKGRTVKQRVPIEFSGGAAVPVPSALTERLLGKSVRLTPRVETNFRRITLVGHNNAERVTIDTDLVFDAEGHEKRFDNLVIAEVKQERARRDSAIRQCLRGCGVRPMRMSKYCLGSAMLYPALKHNSFKRKLLALRGSLNEVSA